MSTQDEKNEILEFTVENVISTIRKNPDKQQKDLAKFFVKNSKAPSPSQISDLLKENNIAPSNNLLFIDSVNRPVLFWKNDLNLQLNFMKFGKYIRRSLNTTSKIMISNCKYLSKDVEEDKTLYTITIHLNNNSIASFFKYIEYINKNFKLNIHYNTIGYKCINLTFDKKNSAIRFKKLLKLLKSGEFKSYTVFECMSKCNYHFKK